MPTTRVPRRILVVRNDRLGDFMLALPAFAMLAENLPDAELTALVPAYTAPIGEACGWLDQVMVDESRGKGWGAGLELGSRLRTQRFDAVVTFFSTLETGLAVWRAGIAWRTAPATKLYQIFYNQRVVQRRSRSEKPEWEYNLDLARAFLEACGVVDPAIPSAPYLRLDPELARARELELRGANGIAADRMLVFVHPGSGGSAANLDVEGYARLLHGLESGSGHHLVISAGPGEEAKAEALAGRLADIPHSIYRSRFGLVEFARHLQAADVFISGSTGPLHIAGALDVPTAAFYPGKRSGSALRWRTTNSPGRHLAFSPPEGAGETEMEAIDLDAAAADISRQFLF